MSLFIFLQENIIIKLYLFFRCHSAICTPFRRIYTLHCRSPRSPLNTHYTKCACCVEVPFAPNTHIHFGFCRDAHVAYFLSRLNLLACRYVHYCLENPAQRGDIEKDPLVFGTLPALQRSLWCSWYKRERAYTARTKRYRSLPVVAPVNFRYNSFLGKPRRWLSAIDNVFSFMLRIH